MIYPTAERMIGTKSFNIGIGYQREMKNPNKPAIIAEPAAYLFRSSL